jgi:hypothetical protein
VAEADEDNSFDLSFVDLVANGMVSLFILFMLMALIRGIAESEGQIERAVTDAVAGDSDEDAARASPFMIVVTSPPRTELFLPKGPQWELAAFTGASPRGSHGANYAILLSEEYPGGAVPVRLGGVKSQVTITAYVVGQGHVVRRWTAVPDPDGKLRLWPVAAEVGKP